MVDKQYADYGGTVRGRKKYMWLSEPAEADRSAKLGCRDQL
jgi:hypothetical protein